MRKSNKQFFIFVLAASLTVFLMIYCFTAPSYTTSNAVYETRVNRGSFTDVFLQVLAQNLTRNFVFLDLGANKGDSLYTFFGVDSKEFNPYGKFPVLIDTDLVNKVNWTVYAFEANPIFNANLINMKAKLPAQHTLHLHNGTAAWIYNGYIDFYLDLVNKDKNFWGSRLNIKEITKKLCLKK